MSKKIFNKREIMDYLMLGLLAGQLFMILKVVRKIEGKIEHPDDRPKSEKRWGWGKKR